MTDTPVPQPPSPLEALKAFIGDLARPFAIIVTSLSAAVVPVIVAVRTAPDRLDLVAAAAFVGAIYAGSGAYFGFKAWEVTKAGKHAAEVEIAKTQSTTGS